jgi:hypothetical protein
MKLKKCVLDIKGNNPINKVGQGKSVWMEEGDKNSPKKPDKGQAMCSNIWAAKISDARPPMARLKKYVCYART